MMKKLLLSAILVLSSVSYICAQDVSWARKRSTVAGAAFKGLVSDDGGNIFDFGSRMSDWIHNNNQVSDTLGSYISKYDPLGNLLFQKVWKTSFYIEDIVYSEGRLYFTGSFYGNITVDGFNLRSRGGTDAFLGEMDLQGKILSVKSFGGRRNDLSFGLSVGPVSRILYVTGGVSDTVFIDNQVIVNKTQALFIARFTRPATLIGFRFYDFEPGNDASLSSTYQRSIGREIVTDANDNIYLLHDREGQSTMDDTPGTRPKEGRYVSKINSSGNILWSNFVSGDECYYGEGNQANSLQINGNGDAYVIKYCAGKYGGSGTLLRYNSANGSLLWSYSNGSEFGYSDIFIDKTNAVFLVGNEGGIPYGEDYRYGYDIVKKFDQNNFTVWETKLLEVSTSFLIKDPFENVYLAGILRGGTARLGNTTLTGEYGEGFLAKMTDKSVSISYLNGNDLWKYLDNGSDPGVAWRSAGYSDASWKSGSSQLGYGDGDEATVVGYGSSSTSKYITTYFRKLINIANPSQFSHFELSLLKDDGAVVYINGIEVLRSNMPSGTITPTTRASSALDAPLENSFKEYSIPVSRFVAGNNIIAVEVHQSSSSSSDMSFNMKLRGVAVSVNPSNCSASGTILREYWANVSGDHVYQIPINTPPTSTSYLSSFQGPSSSGDNYGSRIRGYICPPATGNYTFWIASDDDAELWLSTDDNPSNKRRIAYVSGWTDNHQWEKYPTQRSVSIPLKQGGKYYIEALHKEALGEDHIAVGWGLPDGTLERPVPGIRLAPASASNSQVLIAAKSAWKYLDNGSDQGTSWTGPAFNDGAWKTGNAELGYGDGDEVTQIGYGPDKYNKYITTYFRKSFNVDNAQSYSTLELSLKRDDGAVVYLNGNEIFRSNMSTGPVSYRTLAMNYADGASEYTFVKATLPASYLVNGQNVVAVEIHQSSASSSDISFDLELRGSNNSNMMSPSIVNEDNAGLEPGNNLVQFNAYPNPFSGELFVDFELNEEVPTSIELFDGLGRKVLSLSEQNLMPGTQTYSINARDLRLPSGMYLLRFHAGEESSVKKVLYNE